ncbi:MCE family protein [Nocardioides ultimimeridianus]
MRRAVDAGLGLVYLGLAGVLVLVAAASYQHVFSDDITVVLHADAVGNSLRTGSDVTYLGVPVGTVARIESSADGATLTLDIDSDRARTIPRAVVAQMVPESLFGERDVSLVQAGDATTGLRDGQVIAQDSSDRALQLQQVFDALLPVLKAVQPEKLNATLGALTTALRGQGPAIGDAMDAWGRYLRRVDPAIPALSQDLDRLGSVANTYAVATPDLLAALSDLATTAHTVTDMDGQLHALFTAVTSSSDTASGWIGPNSGTVIAVAAKSRAVLDVLGRYAAEFPCLASTLTAMVPRVDRALGAGTSRPGLHVRAQVVASRRPYTSGPSLSSGTPSCPDPSGGTRSARAWAGLMLGPSLRAAGSDR